MWWYTYGARSSWSDGTVSADATRSPASLLARRLGEISTEIYFYTSRDVRSTPRSQAAWTRSVVRFVSRKAMASRLALDVVRRYRLRRG